ncbi:MAG: truncated hemoglobin family protein [Spirochaetota bacterium]
MDEEIERLSGIARERAMRIDEVNLAERLGLETIRALSTEFYTRVFNDEQQWFRNIFRQSTIEEAIQNQMEFFFQRLGGEPLYSQRKGHPALIARHIKFNMSLKATERWVYHMQNALAAIPAIDADSRERMLDFFTHTAYFLHIGCTARQRASG